MRCGGIRGEREMRINKLVPGDCNELSHRIRQAIGADDYEEVEVVLSPHEREDGRMVVYYPTTIEEYDRLKTLPKKLLLDIGLGQWEEGHWLYPWEWYDYIPEGYTITGINGNNEPFQHGKKDNDKRFGLLPYGFKRIEVTP